MSFKIKICTGTDGKTEFTTSFWKLIDTDFEEEYVLNASSGSHATRFNPIIDIYERRGLPIVPNLVACLLAESAADPMGLFKPHGGYGVGSNLDWIMDTSKLGQLPGFRAALFEKLREMHKDQDHTCSTCKILSTC